MTDPTERFIEAAVAPLADNAELQMMAAQELRAAISAVPERAGGDSLEQAAENLESGVRRRRWKAVLYFVTALVAVLALIPVARDYADYRLATYTLFGMSDPDVVHLPGLPYRENAATKVPAILGNFSQAEELLLFGEVKASNHHERFKPLWGSNPENAAYFAEHARALGEWGAVSLPPRFLETADRLDPENAWFRCFAAGFAAREAVQDNRTRPVGKKSGLLYQKYVVKDPAKLAEVVTLLEEAARLPRFDSYETELFLRRIEILPPGDDVLGRRFVEAYLEMVPPGSRWIHRQIARAVMVAARENAASGDAEAFLKLTDSWETFVRRSVENPGLPPVGAAWALLGFSEVAAELAIAAKTLGLAEKEARYSRLVGDFKARGVRMKDRPSPLPELRGRFSSDTVKLLQMRNRVEDPPPLAGADLRPGVMAEQAMFRRLGSVLFAGLMLVVATIAAAVRFVRGSQVRRLSGALIHVLRPVDHAWILIGGVIVPVVIHGLAEHFAPAGSIDFEKAGSLMSLVFRFLLLAASVLTFTNLIAARRLSQRVGCLGWEKPNLSPASLLGLGLAALLACGLARYAEISPALLIGWVFTLVLLLLNVLIMPLGVLFSPRASAVRWLTYCRAVVPAYAVGVLLMALLIPFHHFQERQWTRLNVLTRIEPGVPAMNRYEHEVAELMRAELLEILDAKP